MFKSISEKMHVGGMFCDLTKAFDCVSHEIMLTKLHFYGIQGSAAHWFGSYLTNRRQRVAMKSSDNKQKFYSNWGVIKHGVPPRSILGPVPYIIYVSDLPPTINTLSEPIIFTDDTSIIISGKKFDDFHTTSNVLCCRMSKWFSAKTLALNLDKTTIIKFITKNSPQRTLSIGYKEKYTEVSMNTKFLLY
jgi:hypothetical protein